MFGKLVKYDLKNMSRPILLVLGVSTSYIVLFGLVSPKINQDIILGLMIFLAWVMLFSALVAYMLIPVWRYAKSMNGREAYFTFSLPVKNSTIFHAKLLSGFLVILLGLISFVINLMILIYAHTTIFNAEVSFSEILDALVKGCRSISFLGWCFIIIGVLWIILGGLLFWYFAVTVGGTAPWNKIGNVGGPIVLGVVIYIAVQVLGFLGMTLPLGFLDLEALFEHNQILITGSNYYQEMAMDHAVTHSSGGFPLSSLVIGIPVLVFQWWACLYSLKRRLSIRA